MKNWSSSFSSPLFADRRGEGPGNLPYGFPPAGTGGLPDGLREDTARMQPAGPASQAEHSGLVDAHVHIFPPEVIRRRETYLDRDRRFGEIYSSPKARMATAEEVVAHMDECGVEIAAVVGFSFSDIGLCKLVNDYIVESVRTYRGRLAGLACVAVEAGGSVPTASVAELERCLDAGLVGCGELAPDIYDPSFARLAGVLAERQAPLLVHASEPVGHKYAGKGTFTPAECMALAEACAGTPVIFAHLGGGLFLYELMPEVRKALAHVYYDTAAVPYLYYPQVYRAAIACTGVGKLLFGSDYPLLSPGRYQEDLARVLSAEEKAAVTQQNARHVYRLGECGGRRQELGKETW